MSRDDNPHILKAGPEFAKRAQELFYAPSPGQTPDLKDEELGSADIIEGFNNGEISVLVEYFRADREYNCSSVLIIGEETEGRKLEAVRIAVEETGADIFEIDFSDKELGSGFIGRIIQNAPSYIKINPDKPLVFCLIGLDKFFDIDRLRTEFGDTKMEMTELIKRERGIGARELAGFLSELTYWNPGVKVCAIVEKTNDLPEAMTEEDVFFGQAEIKKPKKEARKQIVAGFFAQMISDAMYEGEEYWFNPFDDSSMLDVVVAELKGCTYEEINDTLANFVIYIENRKSNEASGSTDNYAELDELPDVLTYANLYDFLSRRV